MKPFEIIISEEIHEACPQFVGCAVMAEMVNSQFCKELWDEIGHETEKFRERHTTESIKQISGIAATRQAYRRCGKDPSRYRPSNEQLVRRIIQGKDLYQIDTAVDLVNLASMRFGYSIGGFDADKIAGERLILGIGKEGEPYEGIGRGVLNIAGMPVYRDAIGGIGTPTSDHERTKLSLQTTQFLALINGYDGQEEHAWECGQFIAALLRKYAQSTDVTLSTYRWKG